MLGGFTFPCGSLNVWQLLCGWMGSGTSREGIAGELQLDTDPGSSQGISEGLRICPEGLEGPRDAQRMQELPQGCSEGSNSLPVPNFSRRDTGGASVPVPAPEQPQQHRGARGTSQ